jgi:hypothetical protein
MRSPAAIKSSPRPGRTGEPGTGNDARTFGPDVITALRLLSEVINEGRSTGRLTVRRASRCKAEDWIWSALLMTHRLQISVA